METNLISSFEAKEATYISLFDALPGNCFLIKNDPPRYTIIAATSQHLKDTGASKETLIGSPLFEAYPGNREEPNDSGEEMLGSSLEYVINNRTFHEMELQRYDVLTNGVYKTRFWKSQSSPVFSSNGEVEYILHSAKDVTNEYGYNELNQVVQKEPDQQEKYRLLIESMDQGYCVIEMIFDEQSTPIDYLILEVNPVFEKHNGLKDAIGKTMRQMVPDAEGHWFERYGKVALTGESVRFIEPSEALGGRWFDAYAFKMGDKDSNKVAILFTDITERIKAEEAIKGSENNLRNMILHAPVAMCILDGPSFNVTIANDRMFEIWGKPSGKMLGKPIFEGLPEVKDQGLEQLLQQVYRTGETFFASELPVMINRNGKDDLTFLNFVYEPFRSGNGKITGVIAVAIEVTEQVVARKKIEESEAGLKRFKFMADHALDQFILMRRDGSFAYLNDKAIEAWGYQETELKHLSVPDIDPNFQKEEFNALFAKANQQAIPKFETLHKRKNGIIYPVEVNINAITLNEEPYLFAVARDITDAKEARNILEQSETRSRLAIDAARLGTFEINIPDQTIFYSNRTAEIFGFDPSTSHSYYEFQSVIHKDDKHIRLNAHEESMKTGSLFYEARVIHPDKSIHWIRLNGTRINKNGVAFLYGTIMDITKDKKAAELLEQKIEERTSELKQLNEQLRQFTYAASHDLQEPLRKITFFLDRLMTNIGPILDEDNKKVAQRIVHTTERMRGLIDDLLDYSNATLGVTAFQDVDIHEIVSSVIDDMEAVIIETQAVVSLEELPRMKGDQRQLRQLFQNLVGNALKYHKKGEAPVVHIRSEIIKGEDAEQPLPVERRTESFYLIEVRDHGIGFDQEDANRIFNLFQRLHGKAEYKGTGVGLAIAEKVVTNHNGFIWSTSQPGKGASFKLLLRV